jgi:hypothetical protein
MFAHSSKSRNYSADASWTPKSWAGVDASYSKLHLDTLSGIAYFQLGQLTRDRSVYVSNIHAGSISGRFSAGGRVDFLVGYTHVQDTGGDYPGVPPPATIGFQTFPLTYHSPMGRVSVRLHTRLRLNAGYQHYRYAEEIASIQNYRAHTGFSSLSWSF